MHRGSCRLPLPRAVLCDLCFALRARCNTCMHACIHPSMHARTHAPTHMQARTHPNAAWPCLSCPHQHVHTLHQHLRAAVPHHLHGMADAQTTNILLSPAWHSDAQTTNMLLLSASQSSQSNRTSPRQMQHDGAWRAKAAARANNRRSGLLEDKYKLCYALPALPLAPTGPTDTHAHAGPYTSTQHTHHSSCFGSICAVKHVLSGSTLG
jgi:hypothetical protein